MSGLVFWVSELILWVSGQADGRTGGPARLQASGSADGQTGGRTGGKFAPLQRHLVDFYILSMHLDMDIGTFL